MAKVHPNAVISDQAELADDVEIGPFCVLHGKVKIGAGTRLLHAVTVHGPTTIGQGNVIYPGAAVGYAPQDRKFDPDTPGAGLVIGDRNVIREGVTIHRASQNEPTRLGDDNYLMATSHMAHDCQVGNGTMFANSAVIAGHVTVGDHAILSGNTGVHQFARIGRMAILSGGQGLAQDLPPFCMVVEHRYVSGLNLIGMRRSGLKQHIDPMREAFGIYFMQGHTKPNALRLIREAGLVADPIVAEFVQFIETTKRGISSYRKPGQLHNAD